jgi:hypothetical protein
MSEDNDEDDDLKTDVKGGSGKRRCIKIPQGDMSFIIPLFIVTIYTN